MERRSKTYLRCQAGSDEIKGVSQGRSRASGCSAGQESGAHINTKAFRFTVDAKRASQVLQTDMAHKLRNVQWKVNSSGRKLSRELNC